MRVENINPNINFNANVLRFKNDFVPKVGHLSKITGKYEQSSVNCLLIDDSSEADITALYNIARDWQYVNSQGHNANFITNIYYYALKKSQGSSFYDKVKTYVLTSQTDNFENLDGQKILAVASVEDSIPNIAGHISYIQGNPDYTYVKGSLYAGVGTSLMKCLQKVYNHITLKSEKSYSVKQFYRKNNFIEEPKNSCNFKWSNDIFSILGINVI